MKKKYIVYAITATISIAYSLWLALSWMSFLKKPLVPPQEKNINFLLPHATSIQTLAFKLQDEGILKQPIFFIALAYLNGSWRSLQAGEYSIMPGTLPHKLLQQIVKGETVLHAFTIVEGWTFRQMLTALAKNPYIAHTLIGKSDSEIMKSIGREGEAAEGRFAADTYFFHISTKDIEILKIAYKLLREKLILAWENRATELPYPCPYMALICASIIEKETALQSERLKISGIIARRLQKNMHLNLDPTVIYGLTHDFTKKNKLTPADLKIDTIYNTYIHYGLPPTPISMPSIESIEAALHPAFGDELYYVAKGDGTHEFSATLEQQDKAIQKYK